MINLFCRNLQLTSGDVLYELGCGDARFLIAAAKRHDVRGVGVEYSSELVKRAERNVEDHGVGHLVCVLFRVN